MSYMVPAFEQQLQKSNNRVTNPTDQTKVLEGWRAAITVGTNDGPLTGLSNRY